MPSLTVRVLGPFRLWREGEPVSPEEWPTQKAKTLLKVLLTERGHVVPSDRLIELVWPDLKPSSAANSLHVATSHLRRLLEPELASPADSKFILTRRQGYRFNVSRDCWIDVDAFWDALSRGDHWARHAEWGPAVAAFRAAEDLYHGNYLEEDPYEDWAIAPRERLREAYLKSLSRLAGCCARLGEYQQAVNTCEKALAEDPVRESTYRQLIVYHYRLGQRDQALRAYERCREALTEILDVEPMPQTRELGRRVRKGKPVEDPLQLRSRPARPEARRSSSPTELPMVGREGELRTLEDHLRQVMAGRGRVVFITGEAGVGKTRLAEAVLARARDRGVQVLRGKCHEIDRDLPFQPVREALRPYVLRRLAPERARRVLGPWAPQVALLLPEVREMVPDIPAPEDLPSQQARQRLLHGLARFCISLAGRYPLLVFIDDLQWADPSTLQFFDRLGREIGHEPVLLLGAFRAGEVDAEHPLTAVLPSLEAPGLASRLSLSGLSAEQAARLVAQRAAPGWTAADFSHRLYAQTEGNPLFLTELLQSLLEKGVLVEDEAGRLRPSAQTNLEDVALDLPETVKRVIASRWRAATRRAKQVLRAAAVIGRSFDDELLERVCELEMPELLDALDELVRRRLIREPREAENGEHVFRHDQIRQSVYEDLSQVRLRRLHLSAAAALEADYAGRIGTVAGQLARHYATAGRHEKALHYLIQAGDRAARQHAYTEATAHYNQALKIARRGAASYDQLVRVRARRGRLLELDSQYEEALANYEEMESLARRHEERSAELTALMAQVTLHATFTALFDPARAEVLAERAIGLARDLDDPEAEARLLWNLSILYRNTMRLSQAVDCGERSLALARELGLREQTAFALHDLSAAYFFLGPLDRSVAMFQEVSELWRELDNRPMLADSLAGRSQVQSFSGEYDQAVAAAEEAFEISASIDNLWGQVNSRGGHIGHIYWEQGRPDRAFAVLNEVESLSEEAEHLPAHVFSLSVLAAVYGSLGAVARGLETARRALLLTERKLRFARPRVLGILALLHLQNEDLDEAEATIERGRAEFERMEGALFFLWLRLAEGELAGRRGEPARAQALMEVWLADLRRLGARTFVAPALHIQGRALLADGHLEAARRTLEEARAEAEDMGSQRMLWQIQAALAEVETRQGDEAAAERLRRQARAIVTGIADHAPTPELRASFLARPSVRAVREER